MAGAAPFGFSRVVFLSHVLTERTPVFPGDPPVELALAATIGVDGYYLQRLTCGEQSGTHWAAAAHFRSGEPTADDLDATDFFFPAVVLDRRLEAAADPDYSVSTSDIERWEAEFGPIPAGAAVLLLTGYDERFAEPQAYLGLDSDGGMHYPGFSGEAAQWLVEQRRVRALGTDTMGVDPGIDTTFAANQILLGGRRVHLENLRGLAELPPAGGWIIVGGIRTRAGSGSPATIFGLVP
ncbi:MAG TPA: cyclase family protein [Streptosporangiaceae bacterium]|jgi:kynurenine formamidase|nr:cyclase family protein [Streptosporangiaceae bacterium]